MQNRILIVGGGISGLFLAKHLMSLKKDVLVLDNGNNQSSLVAAGLINPIVFRRMTKSWRVDDLLNYSKKFYRELENELRLSFFHAITIRRLFSSEQELNFWKEKEFLEDYKSYLNPLTRQDLSYNLSKNDYGSGRVNECFYVDAKVLLNALHENLKHNGCLLNESFDFNQFKAESLIYKTEKFEAVIFSEGKDVLHNPLFKDIPVAPTKGELLTITHHNLSNQESLNRKCFVIPLGNNNFRVGATYVWNTDDCNPTEEGKEELKSMFQYLSDAPFNIIEQTAGVRPTTHDRRPYCGEHREFKNVYCFNGMGAKGYLIAPLLSKEMVDFIINGSPLHQEVALYRKKN